MAGGPKSGRVSNLMLPENFTAQALSGIMPCVKKIVKGKNDVLIELSEVDVIDTAGLQLLLVFFLQIKEQGREVTWSTLPASVLSAARQAGFSAHFGWV